MRRLTSTPYVEAHHEAEAEVPQVEGQPRPEAEQRAVATALARSIEEAAAALRAGDLTSLELTRAVLDRADRHDGWLGSFLARFPETALERAELADKELASGTDLGPLHGIPVGVKDILAAKEGPTTAQSLVLDPAWGAGWDAPVVTRLRDAGAVIVGKTTTMEFAIGTPDSEKPFPIPCNPWDKRCTPGGSSSGSGSGAAAGFFLAAIGTDTGGSIRLPAAYCGVSGLMPTFGRVPKSGVVPLGYSLDHVGPLAPSAWDCAAVLEAIAGFDATDPDCADRPVPDLLGGIDAGIEGVRIGVVHEHHDCDPGVRAAFDAAAEQLAALGADVREVTIPLYQEMTAVSLLTMAAEAFAYHRNDMGARWDDYARGTRALVPWGALLSGADYVQAQRVRRIGQQRLSQLLTEVDVVLTPTTGTPASEMGGDLDLASAFGAIHTLYWDAVGNPVLALPCGFVDGLPVSMQLAGRPWDEALLVQVGHAYQGVTDWHRRTPDLEAQHG